MLGIEQSSSNGSCGRASSIMSRTRELVFGERETHARDINASLRGTHGVGDTDGSGVALSPIIPVALESSSDIGPNFSMVSLSLTSSAEAAVEAAGVRRGEVDSGRLVQFESRVLDPKRSLSSRAFSKPRTRVGSLRNGKSLLPIFCAYTRAEYAEINWIFAPLTTLGKSYWTA